MPTALDQPVVTAELCDAFALAADDLVRHRADNISESSLQAFIELGWMEWHGGLLRLTTLGRMALLQVRSRMVAALADS